MTVVQTLAKPNNALKVAAVFFGCAVLTVRQYFKTAPITKMGNQYQDNKH